MAIFFLFFSLARTRTRNSVYRMPMHDEHKILRVSLVGRSNFPPAALSTSQALALSSLAHYGWARKIVVFIFIAAWIFHTLSVTPARAWASEIQAELIYKYDANRRVRYCVSDADTLRNEKNKHSRSDEKMRLSFWIKNKYLSVGRTLLNETNLNFRSSLKLKDTHAHTLRSHTRTNWMEDKTETTINN